MSFWSKLLVFSSKHADSFDVSVSTVIIIASVRFISNMLTQLTFGLSVVLLYTNVYMFSSCPPGRLFKKKLF